MSIGTDYERLFKLWVKCWNLVLEEKRHFEMMVAILQKVVFESSGWPKFKNWPEICQIKDDHIRFALSAIDLDNRTSQDEQLISAFPDCFSQDLVAGPIPRSLLEKSAMDSCAGGHLFDDPEYGKERLQTCDALTKHDVPHTVFTATDEAQQTYPDFPRLPACIPSDASYGEIFTWAGGDVVVVEESQYCGEVTVAPVTAIAWDA